MTDFDFLSDDFDIDTYLANEEKREEIEQLDQLASDCNDKLQYAKAEKFYQRAAELAEEINDAPQRMNGCDSLRDSYASRT